MATAVSPPAANHLNFAAVDDVRCATACSISNEGSASGLCPHDSIMCRKQPATSGAIDWVVSGVRERREMRKVAGRYARKRLLTLGEASTSRSSGGAVLASGGTVIESSSGFMGNRSVSMP